MWLLLVLIAATAEAHELRPCDDIQGNVCRVEQQFKTAAISTDATIKHGGGLLHTLTCSPSKYFTPGTLDIINSTGGAGTVLQHIELHSAIAVPFTLVFDIAFSEGLYVDFTAAQNVHCSLSYR